MNKPIYSTSQTTNIQSNRHNLHSSTKIIQRIRKSEMKTLSFQSSIKLFTFCEGEFH